MSDRILIIAAALCMVPISAPYAAAQAVQPGTRMLLRLDTPLSTRYNRRGDSFRATVLEPRRFEGATIRGHIRNIERSGRVEGRTEMSLSFDSIQFRGGEVHPLRAHLREVFASDTVKFVTNEGQIVSPSRTGKTLKRSGIGAAIGGVLGGVIGGGKGALLGGLLGAGVGAGSVYAKGVQEIRMEPGTEMEIETGYGGGPPQALARSDRYGNPPQTVPQTAFEQNPRLVREAQRALSAEGYHPGAHDAHMGPRTREAIRNFQRDHGLRVTGVIDRPTARRLGIR